MRNEHYLPLLPSGHGEGGSLSGSGLRAHPRRHPPAKGPKAFIEVCQKNLIGMHDYYQKNIKDMVVEMEAGD
jgi:hypothetical protein